MDRPGQDNPLAKRVLASASRAAVILGPAACGKTTAALDLYRHCERACGGPALLIAPNVAGANELKQKLLDQAPTTVQVKPNVTTFAALAADILSAGGKEQAGHLSAFARRLLLRKTVDQLVSAGRLGTLAGIADTPGLALCLDRDISELKRAAVEPEALAGAIGTAPGKTRDLLEIYREYQRQLMEQGRYDLEGRMWLARDCLAAGGSGCPGVGAEMVIVDGFTDFTPTQLEILRLLAGGPACPREHSQAGRGRGKKVVITLPWTQDTRGRMWHWTRRTLNRLRGAFGNDLDEIIVEPDPAADRPKMARTWDRVFDFDAETCPAPSGLSVIAAAGIDAEVAAVARRVKAMLIGGAPAGSIAVIMRSADSYRPTIQRIFAECEIPIAGAPQPLTDVPIIRFAIDAASLGPDFAFRDVVRIITSSYFNPAAAAMGPCDATTVPAAMDLIRRGNVLQGRGAYSAAAERLSLRDAPPEADAAPPVDYAAAGGMLEKLFEISGRSLGEIVSALELTSRACEHAADELVARDLRTPAARDHRALTAHDLQALVARDLRALAAFEAALGELDDDRPSRSALVDALSAVSCPPARGESLVDVTDVLDIRAVRRKHVFLLGLGQGQFPARQSAGALISESDRARWLSRGVELDSRTDLDAREMLLFYMAISRCDETLTLSYPSSDAGGGQSAASSFLEAVQACAGGADAIPQEEILPGRFVPPTEELCSARDAINAALTSVFDTGAGDAGGALAWTQANTSAAVTQAAMSIWAHTRRWQTGAFDAFDGAIGDAELQNTLSRRFGAEHVFSAGQLETFAQCPWQFFAKYVLALEPLAEPERMLEAVARGLFCHDVLCSTYMRLSDDAGMVDLAPLEQSDVMSALEASIAQEEIRVRRRNPAYPMLWEIQKQKMTENLRRYMVRQLALAAETESLHFELGFGMEGDADNPAAELEPVEVDTPSGAIRLRGRIDRIDRLRQGADGELLVVDYKSGRLPAAKDFQSGVSLQASLYAAAVESIIQNPCAGGVFHHVGPAPGKWEQYFAAVKRRKGTLVEDSAYAALHDASLAKAGEFTDAMRAGRFRVSPQGNCPSYCPYRQICGYSEARAQFKSNDDDDSREVGQ